MQSLSGTRLGRGVLEVLEDRVKEVVRHHQDVTVEDKPSVVTIKVKVLPDKQRRHFGFIISGSSSLSPRKTGEAALYGFMNNTQQVEFKEYDPGQLNMFNRDEEEETSEAD